MSGNSDESVRAAVVARTTEMLRDAGFEAGQPVQTFMDCFTLAEAQRSLFESTYDNPIPVYLTDEEERAVRLPVVITKAERRHERYAAGLDDPTVGCVRYPYWIFEGWVVPSGYDPLPVFERVRIRVSQLDAEELSDTFWWQRIPDSPDPDGQIEVAH